MAQTLELLIDVVSPNTYQIFGPLRAVAERTGTDLRLTPVLNGGVHKLTGNQPPFMRDAGVKGKNEYSMLEIDRFKKKYAQDKLTMNSAFPFSTVNVQRMMIVAAKDGRDIEFADLMLRLIWEDNLNASIDEDLLAALEPSAFDGPALREAANDPAIKQALINNTQAAVDRGAFGVPTVFVGEQMFFGKERLDQIEAEVTA